MKTIKLSSGELREYTCRYDWQCFVQGGGQGLVLSKNGNYTTAFFEAFPNDPNCFIRGEGPDIAAAEQNAWDKYQGIKVCNHEMERRHRTDGYGYCKHCAYSAMVFEPLTKCKICKTPTNYYQSSVNKHLYCQKHYRMAPREDDRYKYLGSKKLPRKLKKLYKSYAKYMFAKDNLYGTLKISKLSSHIDISCGYFISINYAFKKRAKQYGRNRQIKRIVNRRKNS
jgi:hypothetical protein